MFVYLTAEEKPIQTITKFETIPEVDEEEESTKGSQSAGIPSETDDAELETEPQKTSSVLSLTTQVTHDESPSDEKQQEPEGSPDAGNADSRTVAVEAHQIAVMAEVHPTAQTTDVQVESRDAFTVVEEKQ